MNPNTHGKITASTAVAIQPHRSLAGSSIAPPLASTTGNTSPTPLLPYLTKHFGAGENEVLMNMRGHKSRELAELHAVAMLLDAGTGWSTITTTVPQRVLGRYTLKHGQPVFLPEGMIA